MTSPVLRWRKRDERWAPRTLAPGFMSPCVSWLRVSDLPCGGVCPHLASAWEFGPGVTSHEQHRCPSAVPRGEGCGFAMTTRCKMQVPLDKPEKTASDVEKQQNLGLPDGAVRPGEAGVAPSWAQSSGWAHGQAHVWPQDTPPSP